MIKCINNKSKTIEHKGDIDLVTETDKANEEYIINRLSNAFPNHKFIGEESASSSDLRRSSSSTVSALCLFQLSRISAVLSNSAFVSRNSGPVERMCPPLTISGITAPAETTKMTIAASVINKETSAPPPLEAAKSRASCLWSGL